MMFFVLDTTLSIVPSLAESLIQAFLIIGVLVFIIRVITLAAEPKDK